MTATHGSNTGIAAVQDAPATKFAKDQLRSIIERIETLEGEKKQTADLIKDIYTESKSGGYDCKALRTIVRMRKQDANERAEQETILETYLICAGNDLTVAKPKDKQPWFKFYPQDWRGDAKLRMCSIGARGLWAEMLCVMHEAEPYGYLLKQRQHVTSRQMAALAGISVGECMKYMLELASAGVYSIDENKVIYSRRMVRDKAKAERDRNNGKGGGNPILTGGDNGGVNPQDKAQKPKPSSKCQRPESAAAGAALDEAGLKQEAALKALFVSIRKSLGWSIPNLDQIATWLAAGIPSGTISSAATPMLKRKEDMASLVYCDSAVREAHAAGAPNLQIVSSKVFVIHGTLAWQCWERVSPGGRGWPTRERRDDDGRIQTGWDFETEFPAGVDEATGEKLAPKSDDEVAA
jgi:uncharacterized protein (UPF0335 family)